MNKIITSFICLFIFTTMSFAYLSKDNIGTSAGQFLKLGMGAQNTALGEAVTAFVNDSTSISWNPAGLINVKGNQLSLMHVIYVGDIFYDYITFAKDFQGIGNFGVGIQYLNYGAIREMDINGNELTDFIPYDLAFTLGYATKIFDINVGVNAKYISSKIQNTGSAIAFDLGAQYQYKRTSFGILLQNIGTSMKFIDDYSSLPWTLKAGIGYKLLDNWSIEVDGIFPKDNAIIFAAGMEYGINFDKNLTVIARAGYNTRTTDMPGFKGFSFGMGINYASYQIDYALISFGDFGVNHEISFGIKF